MMMMMIMIMMMMIMMMMIMYAVASKTRVKRNQVRLLIAKTRVTKSILKSVPIARQKFATSVPKLGQASKVMSNIRVLYIIILLY